MKRLLAVICCLLALNGQAHASKRLKGANRKLQQTVTLTRPPEDDPKDGTPMPKDGVTKSPTTKAPTSKAPTGPPKTKAPEVAYDAHGSWASPDASSYSTDTKTKGSNKDNSADSYDSADGASYDGASYDGSTSTKQKETTNRPPASSVKGSSVDPPAPKATSPDTEYKSSGNKNKSSDGGSYKNTKQTASKDNKGTKATKGGYKSKGGGSYDGSSYDYPEAPKGGDKSSSGSKSSSNKGSDKGGSDKEVVRPGATSPLPPSAPGYQGQDGTPLTGVPITRFALLYYIDENLGVPMTSDYEQVHENTYLWLYTVMFRTFGDQMKNLLTDDTSNIFEANQAITIEYASVALFESGDPDLPTKEELDELVVEAFTGENLAFYLESIQDLPRSNPFSTTTAVELDQMPPGEGRTAFGTLANRVATEGMVPMLAAAAACVLLAGGALAYRARRSTSDTGPILGKNFDSFSRACETTAMDDDDYTTSMGTMMSEKRSWDLHLEGDPQSQRNLAPISEFEESLVGAVDPDLARFSDFFDAPDSPSRSTGTEEQSQLSIEDFVSEAERNLLGVRIRYPGQADTASNNVTGTESEQDMSRALVPAPPSSLVPFSMATSSEPPFDCNEPIPRTSSY